MGMCDYGLKINTAESGEAVMSDLKAGISNISQALNEVVEQMTFLSDNGWGSSDVVGGQLIVTLTGKRKVGDTAQDFIFSKALSLGDDRKRAFEITDPSGDKISGTVTIAKIGMPSGDVNKSGGDISFELHFNGEPTFTAAT